MMKRVLKHFGVAILLSAMAAGGAAYAAEAGSAPAKTAAPKAAPTGEAMAHTCAACHGTMGEVRGEAFVPLAGMDRQTFIGSMLAYKSLMRPSSIMSHIADGFTPAEIGRMADFFSVLPKPEPDPGAAPVTGAAPEGGKK